MPIGGVRGPLPLLIALVLILEPGTCSGFENPVPGTIVRPYQISSLYEGHFGIDIGVAPGTPVRAAYSGRVSFAGVVVENMTLTLDHGGGLRTSYSFLRSVAVGVGSYVETGSVVGFSGVAHETPALHFSARLGGVYFDPAYLLGCHLEPPARALRLVPPVRSLLQGA